MPLTPYTTEEMPIAGEPEEDFARKAQNKVYADARMVTEINALADLENAATTCTSVTNNNLTPGDKTFTVAAGLGWASGIPGRAAVTGSSTQYAEFVCKSYSGTTLIVTFGTIIGTGTGIITWTITKSSAVSNVATTSTNTFTGVQNFTQGADIPAAATVNLDTATGNIIRVTGNTSINAWTLSNGRSRTVTITGAPLLTYSSTTNNMNSGGKNYQCVGGEILDITADSSVVRVKITPASGSALSLKLQPSAILYTTATTLTSSDFGKLIEFSGSFTVVMPNAAGNVDNLLILKNVGSSIITLNRAGVNSLYIHNQVLTSVAFGPGSCLILASDGAHWYQIGGDVVREYAQSWQDVSASRAVSTTYTNDAGRDIEIIVHGVASTVGQWIVFTINGLAIPAATGTGQSSVNSGGSITIPNGATYSFAPNAGTITSLKVFERR